MLQACKLSKRSFMRCRSRAGQVACSNLRSKTLQPLVPGINHRRHDDDDDDTDNDDDDDEDTKSRCKTHCRYNRRTHAAKGRIHRKDPWCQAKTHCHYNGRIYKTDLPFGWGMFGSVLVLLNPGERSEMSDAPLVFCPIIFSASATSKTRIYRSHVFVEHGISGNMSVFTCCIL